MRPYSETVAQNWIFNFFKRAGRTSYAIGMFLGFIHWGISWNVINGLIEGGLDAQWQLIFVYFFPFDFPFSLLYFVKLPMYDIDKAKMVYGVIGPIWYFFAPVIFSSLWKLKPRFAVTFCVVPLFSLLVILLYMFH
jgi:hypothetical protein